VPWPTARPDHHDWSAVLDVAGPDEFRTSFPFRAPRVVVGRKRPSDLSLPDHGVSSEHCEFVAEEGFFIVRDLGSFNGTYVNERRVSEARLRDGDVVRIGGTRITVVIQGEVRGSRVVTRLRSRWHWLVLGGAALAGATGLLVMRRNAAGEEAHLRQRYAAAVRAQLQETPCQLAASHFAALRDLDTRIAGRQVPVPARGGKLTAADREAASALLALYQQKADLYGLLLQALRDHQQRERDGLERVSRLGGRLAEARDRKVAFWAEGQLSERVARGEAFLEATDRLARETARFGQLVESVSLRGETAMAAELTAFRFSGEAWALLRTCEADFSRATSGALGALNALDEE
jgi:hypothetical protein